MAKVETGRKPIEGKIKKTGVEFKKSAEQMEKDVKTKKVVAEAAGSANVEGTDEGMKKIEEAMKEAGKKTDERFDKDDTALRKVVENDAKPIEQNLKQMSDKTAGDQKKIEKSLSQSQIEEPKGKIKEAVSAAQEDKKFTDTKRSEQEKDRTKAEKNAADKGRTVKSTKVNFKR